MMTIGESRDSRRSHANNAFANQHNHNRAQSILNCKKYKNNRHFYSLDQQEMELREQAMH